MQIERSFSVPFLFIVLAICLFASLSYAQTEIVLHNFLGGPKMALAHPVLFSTALAIFTAQREMEEHPQVASPLK
ncbi:MAG: hypothetical protein ABSC33_14255 [Candidatus Sulfotelmatobacter sp.]|jgi:hypothetical protein